MGDVGGIAWNQIDNARLLIWADGLDFLDILDERRRHATRMDAKNALMANVALMSSDCLTTERASSNSEKK